MGIAFMQRNLMVGKDLEYPMEDRKAWMRSRKRKCIVWPYIG